MKQQTQTPEATLPHVSTYGRYNEIRGILDRQRSGIDCEEHESAAIKTWVKYEKLAPGNGSIELDTEIQELLPNEWGEAQDEIGNCDEHGKLKEIGLIKIYSPKPEATTLHTKGEWTFDGMELILCGEEVIADIRSCNHDGMEFDGQVFNRSQEEAVANAELIVKAVNERQALLDRVNDLEHYVGYVQDTVSRGAVPLDWEDWIEVGKPLTK